MRRLATLIALVLAVAGCAAADEPDDVARYIVTKSDVYTPAAPGRHPGVVLLHGCGGKYPHEAAWGEALASRGFVVIVPDSFAARGWTRDRGRRTACNGLGLWGQERAGDALYALEALRRRADVDPNRLGLLGFSHGGWTALDLMALNGDKLKREWLDAAPRATEGLDALAVVYPYCGFAAAMANPDWVSAAPILILQAGADRTVSNADCDRMAANQRARGVAVEVHAYPGLPHGFDFDPRQNDGYNRNYDAQATRDAFGRVADFFNRTMKP